MWKIAFLQLFDTKGFSKCTERHLEEGKQVNEANLVKVDLHYLATIMDLFNDMMLSVVLIHPEIAIIALKIVSDDSEGPCVILCQSVEPFKKVFYTVFASKMFGACRRSHSWHWRRFPCRTLTNAAPNRCCRKRNVYCYHRT